MKTLFEEVNANHFWGRFVFKAKSFMAALQVNNLLDVVVNFEDGLVEEEIDKFNNGNNVKLNNFGDDFIE